MNRIFEIINPKTYYYWLRRIREAAYESLPAIGDNNTIVPVSIPANPPADIKNHESQSHIILHYDNVTLEINNNASAVLIENILRAVQNVR
ncbi:hypothetical protein [Oxobacter pfennigii]|uniref:hypothetical protein n=1 Tax=Oxobacter pfennigii TaxID=36849 RepID=UPI00128F63BA|nr:hypothetical protein [Oxobacter pfennigii]